MELPDILEIEDSIRDTDGKQLILDTQRYQKVQTIQSEKEREEIIAWMRSLENGYTATVTLPIHEQEKIAVRPRNAENLVLPQIGDTVYGPLTQQNSPFYNNTVFIVGNTNNV
jgi:hypothetical protein